jgi:hypothetical protein
MGTICHGTQNGYRTIRMQIIAPTENRNVEITIEGGGGGGGATINYNYVNKDYESMKRNIALAAEAPTQKDLDDYPGLKNAWDQYVIVKKLIKGQ